MNDRSSRNILIVEDHLQMRTMLKTILVSFGFKKVLQASDGIEALSLIKEADLVSRDRLHLVISDWNMPKMSGLDLLTAVRSDRRHKNLPFIMLTSQAEQDSVLDAMKAGVTDYLVKPFTPKVLEQKLEGVFPELFP
jgi:two-component system, chemotaxis family, chemotaxis protein CheY